MPNGRPKPEALPPGRVRLHALLINDYGAHMDIRHDLSP